MTKRSSNSEYKNPISDSKSLRASLFSEMGNLEAEDLRQRNRGKNPQDHAIDKYIPDPQKAEETAANINSLLATLEVLNEKAASINSTDSPLSTQETGELLENLLNTQKELVLNLRRQRIDLLRTIYSATYTTESCLDPNDTGSHNDIRRFSEQYAQMNNSILMLQNMPSIDEYQKQIDGLTILVESQRLTDGDRRKADFTNDEMENFTSVNLYREVSSEIAAGFKKCYQVADGFNKDPYKKSDNAKLVGIASKTLDAAMSKATNGSDNIENSKKKITDLNTNAVSTYQKRFTNLINSDPSITKPEKLGNTLKELEETLWKMRTPFDQQLNSEQKKLQQIIATKPPSGFERFLTAITFGLYKGGIPVAQREETIKTQKNIQDLESKIGRFAGELEGIYKVESQIKQEEQTLEFKNTIHYKLSASKISIPESSPPQENNALADKMTGYLKYVTDASGLGPKGVEKSYSKPPKGPITTSEDAIFNIGEQETALYTIFQNRTRNNSQLDPNKYPEKLREAVRTFVVEKGEKLSSASIGEFINKDLQKLGFTSTPNEFKQISDAIKSISGSWKELKKDMTAKPPTQSSQISNDNKKEISENKKEAPVKENQTKPLEQTDSRIKGPHTQRVLENEGTGNAARVS